MCRMHCNAKKIWEKVKGMNGREIEYNPYVFMSAERITDARSHGGWIITFCPLISLTPSIFLMTFVL